MERVLLLEEKPVKSIFRSEVFDDEFKLINEVVNSCPVKIIKIQNI